MPNTPKTSNDVEKLIPEHTPKPRNISDRLVLHWAESILKRRFERQNYLNSPESSREFLKIRFADKAREEFGMIFLDNQHGVIGFEVIFQGTIDSAIVYPREIVKAALQREAAAVILAHNHPSGCAEPSEADRRITDRIVSALALVDIKVIDHLIIGGEDVVSFAERGLL